MANRTLRIARRVALLILTLGIVGIVAGAVGSLVFSFDEANAAALRVVFALGVLYLIVSLILLLILRQRESKRAKALHDLPTTFVDLDSAPPTSGDDLTRIEGVWPTMAAALRAAGLTTYAQVAQQTPDALRQIVKDAGIRLVSSTASWPVQARYLAAGDTEGLREYLARATDEHPKT